MAPRKTKTQGQKGEKDKPAGLLVGGKMDSLLDEIEDSDDDTEAPASTQPETATVPAPGDVSVVTPEKQVMKNRSPTPVDDRRVFYTIEKGTYKHCKHESKEHAMDFFEKAKMFEPNIAERIIVQDFENEAAMVDFVNALKVMAGSKRSANPMAAPRGTAGSAPLLAQAAVLPPPVVAGIVPAIDNPYSVAKAVVKRPKLGFTTDKTSTVNDAQLRRFEEAMRNSNTKLDTFHLVMEGSNFDVWGFSLFENDEHYWSWKPLVLEKAIMTELAMPIFEKEGVSMDEMLGHLRAANIRETPGGPNIPSSFVLKSGKKMDRMILFGLIPSPSNEVNVKEAAVKFCAQCKNGRIQAAYRMAMENTMKADSIKKDVGEGGQLWEKLASAANNVVYHKIESLNQVLCDHTIEEIIRLTFGYSGGESPSMWDRRVFKLAFGDNANES
jgi:hypothetical protein